MKKQILKKQAEIKSDILTAAVLGNIAFANGKKRMPCLDVELNAILGKYKGWGCDSDARIAITKEWLDNWDLAAVSSLVV